MKNRNLAKLLVLALSLALLIGTVAGLSVSAANDDLIAAQTIVHGAKIQIAVAVNAPSADGVTVSYQWAGDDTAKSATYDAEAPNAPAGTVVFVTEGVAAYELAKVATITVSYGGNTQTKTYSVAQFLYTQLYQKEVKGAAKDCYEALLAYGDASQIWLNKNASNLVSSSAYAISTDADVTFNGSKFLFIPAGSSVTVIPSYNGAQPLDSWTISYADGTTATLAAGESIEISKTATFIPVFGAVSTVTTWDFEGGEIYNNSSFSTIIKDNTGDWVGGTAEYNEYLAAGTQANSSKDMLLVNGAFMEVCNDPYSQSANKVLKVVSRMVGSKTSFIDVKVEKMSETADVLEFTFDYMADFQNYKSANFNMAYVQLWKTADGKPNADNSGVIRDRNRQFILRSEMASASDTAKFALDASTMTTTKVEGAFSFSANDGNTEAVIDSHTWYKVKLIVADGVMYRYYSADGGNTWNFISQSTGGDDTHYQYPSDLDNASIVINTYNNTCRLYFDNITFVAVDEPSIELPQ